MNTIPEEDNPHQYDQELPFGSISQTLKQCEYSMKYNIPVLFIPGIKLILSLLMAFSDGAFELVATTILSKIFLCLLICHDALHFYIILERIFVCTDIKYLQSAENQQDTQPNLATQEELPLSVNDNQQPSDNQPRIMEFQRNLLRVNIPKKKAAITSLTNISWYLWSTLFMIFIFMGGMSQLELFLLELTFTSFPTLILGNFVDIISIFDIQHDLFLFSIPLLIIVAVEKYMQRSRRVPAMQNIIADLPVIEYNAELPGNSECAICLVDYEVGEKIIQLGCNVMHHFHEGCLKDWLKINGQCPVCRKKVEKPKKRKWKFFS